MNPAGSGRGRSGAAVRSQPGHAGPAARAALLLGRQPPAAAAAMAAAEGALEEGERRSAEAGAELGADGDGRAALSGAGGCDEPRRSLLPLRGWGSCLRPTMAPLTPAPSLSVVPGRSAVQLLRAGECLPARGSC